MLALLTFILGSLVGSLLWILMSIITKKKAKADNLKLEYVLDYDEYCVIDSLVRKRHYELYNTPFEDLSMSEMDEIKILESIRKKL